MANIEGRNSWVSGAWNASDIASAQTHLAPFIDELRGQASSTAPGRTASLIELQVAQLLGLEREWLARAVQAVGNYGEIFDKHLGEKTPLGLKRGLNAQWHKGGLQYAIPIR